MYDFCKAIEIFFADLFHCERVNVVLIHRFKKYLYRIEPDPKSGTHRIVKFELASGIAGYVAISSHSILTESVKGDSKFTKNIDDPKGTEDNPALQMISCPVSAIGDFQ